MDSSFHRFSELFKQLGLPADVDSIKRFLADHSPLPSETALENAPFWNAAQSAFLCDELLRDADWAAVVDQLNAALRSSHTE